MRELTEKEILNRKHFLMFMELIGLSPTSCNAYATTLMSCSDFIKDELEKMVMPLFMKWTTKRI